MQVKICRKTTLCSKCRDKSCAHAGKISADCPKYTCDNPVKYDCENCKFIAKFIAESIESNTNSK